MLIHVIHSFRNISVSFSVFPMRDHPVRGWVSSRLIENSSFCSSGPLSIQSNFIFDVIHVDCLLFRTATITTRSMGYEFFPLWCNLFSTIVFATSEWTGENSSVYSEFSSVEFQWRLSLFEYLRTECSLEKYLLGVDDLLFLFIENRSIHAKITCHRFHPRWRFHWWQFTDLQWLCSSTTKCRSRHVQLSTRSIRYIDSNEECEVRTFYS